MSEVEVSSGSSSSTAPWVSRSSGGSTAGLAKPRSVVEGQSAPTLATIQLRANSATERPSPAPSQPEQRPQGPTLLGCRGLFKSYQKAGLGIPVLQGVDMQVHEGEFLAIVGQSGSGKSTLLHLLGTLDQPDAGEVHFEGHRIDNMPSTARDMLRNRHLGMIFQFYHLLPEFTTLENVLAPALIASGMLGYWRRRGAYRRRAKELLEIMGIDHRAKHKPRELSGGEMQRAAIARALLASPKVLLADEPTGNLDRSTGEQIMGTLVDLNKQQGLTIVMVTHDPWVASQADRTVKLVEGRIETT